MTLTIWAIISATNFNTYYLRIGCINLSEILCGQGLTLALLLSKYSSKSDNGKVPKSSFFWRYCKKSVLILLDRMRRNSFASLCCYPILTKITVMTCTGIRKNQAKFEVCCNFFWKYIAVERWFGHFFRLGCAKWLLPNLC